jgi:hypothetical protein
VVGLEPKQGIFEKSQQIHGFPRKSRKYGKISR